MYEGSIEIIPLAPLPEVEEGADLGALLLEAVLSGDSAGGILAGDLIVVAQKVVSKAEGAVVELKTVLPSQQAREIAEVSGRDPRLIEVILQQCSRIVKFERGVLITETHHGLVCANSGVDASNVPPSAQGDERVTVLPVDPDASALAIRKALERSAGGPVAVIISDSFNRPWREGSINVAIGVSGLAPLQDRRGQSDDYGRSLQATVVSVADEIASAAQLVIGESGRRPAAIIRGYPYEPAEGSAHELMRDPAADLFR